MQTMRTTNGRAILISGFLLIASAGMFMAHTAKAASGSTNDGPTKENALEAEKELGQALRTNDADAFCRLLDPDWAVVSGIGDFDDSVGESNSICAGARAAKRESGSAWTVDRPIPPRFGICDESNRKCSPRSSRLRLPGWSMEGPSSK